MMHEVLALQSFSFDGYDPDAAGGSSFPCMQTGMSLSCDCDTKFNPEI